MSNDATAGEAPDLSNEELNTTAAEATAEGDANGETTPLDPLQTLQTDLDRFRDLALRTQADFENFRKRTAREREDGIRAAKASMLERLLPVVDNFELGLQAARSEGSKGVIIGFEMVARQLNDYIVQSGVEVIDASEGTVFDPNLHDALGQEPSDTVPEGHILRQTRKGYKLQERLIRPANVYVSQGPAE